MDVIKHLGQPYEEQEKILRKLNHVYLEASLDSKYDTISSSKDLTKQKEEQDTCNTKKESKMHPSCVKANELYNRIKEMDCHLNQIHLKCPVHDISLSTWLLNDQLHLRQVNSTKANSTASEF